jgi:hypothetical protein
VALSCVAICQATATGVGTERGRLLGEPRRSKYANER